MTPPTLDDELLPPWRRPATAPRRTTPLTPGAIVEAALHVLDRDGFDALSMRSIAQVLDTGPSSLYAHVRNKDELLDLVFDRILGEVELPDPDPDRWQQQLRDVMIQVRLVFARYRDAARVSMGRLPIGPNGLTLIEWVLGLLRGAGMPDRIAVHAGDLLGLYVGAYGYEETMETTTSSGEALPMDDMLHMIADYLSSLPADRFPNVTAVSDVLVDDSGRFELGLDIILAGLATYAGEQPPPSSASTSAARSPGPTSVASPA